MDPSAIWTLANVLGNGKFGITSPNHSQNNISASMADNTAANTTANTAEKYPPWKWDKSEILPVTSTEYHTDTMSTSELPTIFSSTLLPHGTTDSSVFPSLQNGTAELIVPSSWQNGTAEFLPPWKNGNIGFLPSFWKNSTGTSDFLPTASPWLNGTETSSSSTIINTVYVNCTTQLGTSGTSTGLVPPWSTSNTSGSGMPEMMSTTAAVLTLVPLVIITLSIILGNLLVVIAVFTKRSLRTPQNIYIVSLAMTDMGVALLVLPYNMTTLILQKWIFGDAMCKVYLVMDVSLCCVSIFHLCAIGIDRYRAITDGIHYVQKRNLRNVLVNIFFLWIIALWIGSPTLLAVEDWAIRYDGVSCEMPSSPGFNFYLAIGGLFFPLIIMSVIYSKIYYAIQERLRERARVNCMELTSDADTTDKLDPKSTVSEEESNGNVSCIGKSTKSQGRRKVSAQISTFLVNKQKFSLSKERKAAKTLGIIMAAFVICWLPLGFLNVIGSLCPEGMKPNVIWFHVFTWLGYVNSALNPIIYGVSNQEYQKAFRKILRLD